MLAARSNLTAVNCTAHKKSIRITTWNVNRVLTIARGGTEHCSDTSLAGQIARGYQRDPELQAALDGLFADTIQQGRRRVKNSEVSSELQRLEEVAGRLGLTWVNPDWNDGAFRGLLTTNTSGINEQSECTLARLTFGKVGPADLVVQMDQMEATGLTEHPDLIKGPLAQVADDPARGYSLITIFKIVSNGVIGRMIAKALYEVDPENPSRMNITFCGLQLEPAFPDTQSLALWQEALADHNPAMAPDGTIYVPLEPRPRGFVRCLLMEPDLHLIVGNAGSLSVLKRLQWQPKI